MSCLTEVFFGTRKKSLTDELLIRKAVFAFFRDSHSGFACERMINLGFLGFLTQRGSPLVDAKSYRLGIKES